MAQHKDNFDRFVGYFVANPFEGENANKPLEIVQGIFVPNDPPGVYPIHNMAHYNGIILSVHFIADVWSTAEGSAVMVAPGIAFTAAHVIMPLVPVIMASKLRILCVGYTPSGPRLWRVTNFVHVNDTDLVILSLELRSAVPEDGRFVQAAITTRLPGIGEKVMIAGFRASDEHVAADEHMAFTVVDGKHVKYGALLQIGVGKVTQHYLNGRGKMAPGSAIEVACSTPGGLSGGAAFDRTGRVVGILSSSLNNPDGKGPSLVSLLWPALTMTFVPGFLPQLFPPKDARLLELDDRVCGIDRRNSIRWTFDAATGQYRNEYDAYTNRWAAALSDIAKAAKEKVSKFFARASPHFR